MSWQEPIYNRTKADVDGLKALAIQIASTGWDNISQSDKLRWLVGNPLQLLASDSTLKTSDGLNIIVGDGKILGALNANDLNRIQNNIRYIRDFLLSIGITVIIDDTNPSWNTGDYMVLSNLNRIRDNIKLLRDYWYVFPSTPEVTYSNPANWEDINILEKNLKDMYDIIELMRKME